jgi:hypothetical protein
MYLTMLRNQMPNPNLTASIRQTTEEISRVQYHDAKFYNIPHIHTPQMSEKPASRTEFLTCVSQRTTVHGAIVNW